LRRLVALLASLAAALLFTSAAVPLVACDTENTCAVTCPTGTRFTNDGTCVCEPFDAGYCGLAKNCPDVFCPASSVPDACGGGQLWSTTICGCYPLADAGPPKPDAGTADARAEAASPKG